MRLIENRENEFCWKEIDWSNPLISCCETLIKNLPTKDLTYLYSYFWQGCTEKEIAPLLGLSGKSHVQYFKRKVFARIRMYADLKLSFVPVCMKNRFEQHPYFRKSAAINEVSESYLLKDTIKLTINSMIEDIEENRTFCGWCPDRHICQRRLNACPKTLRKLQKEDYTLEKNLATLKKLLKYLLDWRVYDDADD